MVKKIYRRVKVELKKIIEESKMTYCVACVTQRRHIGITIRHRRQHHKIIFVIFFSGTTQASFLIFGTEHPYGELYRVGEFRICLMYITLFYLTGRAELTFEFT